MTDIDRDLEGLAAHLAWPETPDIATTVGHSITSPTTHRRRVAFVAAAAVAAAFAIVVLTIPAARDRVTAFLGIGAVTIEQRSPAGALYDPALGEELDPATVEVGLPTALGAPDAAFRDSAGRLWIVYMATEGRPDALLTVFDTVVEAGLTKLVADASIQAELVEVDGAPAYWVAGEDHFILFESAGGAVLEDRGRRSSPALIWVQGGATYRLEIDLDSAGAIEIAESVP
jgi:hypothetical protein